MEQLYLGKLAGVNFEPAKSNLQKFVEKINAAENQNADVEIKLTHDKENKYDKNAIRVSAGIGGIFLEVGWIPKHSNEGILKAGIENTKTTIENFNFFEGKVVGLRVNVVLT